MISIITSIKTKYRYTEYAALAVLAEGNFYISLDGFKSTTTLIRQWQWFAESAMYLEDEQKTANMSKWPALIHL